MVLSRLRLGLIFNIKINEGGKGSSAECFLIFRNADVGDC